MSCTLLLMALSVASPARAEDEAPLHPTWYSAEVWIGVADGQLATVSLAGQPLEPRLNLWLLDDRWWEAYDTDRYVCIVSMTASSGAGSSATGAWLDWTLELDPVDASSPACDNLEPAWADAWLPTVPDWITEVTVAALEPDRTARSSAAFERATLFASGDGGGRDGAARRPGTDDNGASDAEKERDETGGDARIGDPSMAEAYAGMWGDSWTPIADVAFGGDMYAMGQSIAATHMGGVGPFVGVAWQVDADLALVDDGLPLNYLDQLALPFLPLVEGSSYLGLADVAAGADGYYWLTTAWLFTPFPCEDADADGVCDIEDTCAGTAAGAVVDTAGCSVADHCPCDADWRNHGAYVSCVAHTSGDFVAAGLLGGREKGMVQSHAAASSCGR